MGQSLTFLLMAWILNPCSGIIFFRINEILGVIMKFSRIAGTGGYLPEKILTNHDLEKFVDTSHDWIVERTGIHQRHIAADDETTATMAKEAAQVALKNAGIEADQLDLIIVATCTPVNMFPSTASELQHLLGASKAGAFDIAAACTGFVYGLSIADQFIRSGQCKHVLVVGSEVLSRALDWKERTTCVLFGDGASAAVLSASDEAGIIATDLHSDGSLGDILYLPQQRTDGSVVMRGREVFRHAVEKLVASSHALLKQCGMTTKDLDWVVPHQANLRIILYVLDKLHIPVEQSILTIDQQANTSAASVGLALHEGVSSGRIQRGQTILLEAFGGGLVWGGALIRF